MKNILILTAIISILGMNQSCKSKKEAQSSTTNTSSSNNCSLRIDFYSIGAGTDYKAMEALTKYIEEKKIDFETKPWGREGEVIYCLKFSNRKEKEVKTIKEEVKKLLANSQLVRIEEDKPISKQ